MTFVCCSYSCISFGEQDHSCGSIVGGCYRMSKSDGLLYWEASIVIFIPGADPEIGI